MVLQWGGRRLRKFLSTRLSFHSAEIPFRYLLVNLRSAFRFTFRSGFRAYLGFKLSLSFQSISNTLKHDVNCGNTLCDPADKFARRLPFRLPDVSGVTRVEEADDVLL